MKAVILGGRLLVAALLLLLSRPLQAQPEIEWQRYWGGRGDDRCWGMIVEDSSRFALYGQYVSPNDSFHYDAWVLEADSDGQMISSHIYNLYEEQQPFGGARTLDGGFILAMGAGMVMRTSRDGEVMWYRTYQGVWDFWGVVAEEDSTFILAGSKNINGLDALVMRINGGGDIIWSHSYGTANREETWGIIKTSDGGFLLPAQTRTEQDGWGAALLKVDSEGDSVWMRTYEPDMSEGLASVIEIPGLGYAATGIAGTIGRDTDFYLLLVDFEGNEIWSRQYEANGRQAAYTIIQSSLDKGFLLGGYGYRGRSGHLLMRTDRNGEPIWSLYYGESASESGIVGVYETADHSYYLGSSMIHNNENMGGNNFTFTKTTPDPLASEPAELAVLDSSLSFPDTSPDSIAFLDFGVVNVGRRYGEVINANVDVDAFRCEVDSGGVRLFPQDTLHLLVGFAPFADSLYHATLSLFIGIDGEITDTLYVTLFGRGVFPNSVSDSRFQLSTFNFQLHPNPFNSSTLINFDLPQQTKVRITVHDLSGREVALLSDHRLEAGRHEVTWDASAFPAGLYLLRLESPEFHSSRKLVLVR